MKKPSPSTVFLLGLALWLFREAIFLGGVFYKRDLHLVWHPQVEGFVRAVLGSAWPLWDPSPAFGQPLLADPSAQILYPLTWLNLLMRPWTYYTVYAVLHFLLAGFGMRALARHLGLSHLASVVAAGTWVLSGPYLSMIDLWHHYAGASWMPFVVLAADRALGGARRDVARFALALALQILAGSADLCAMTLLFAAALGVARHLDVKHPLAATNRSVLARGFGGVLLAAGLTAILWVPALEIVSRASRASLPQSVRTYWSMHPLVALETLLPGLFTSLPLKSALRASFFESREPFLASLYLGVGALALVAAAAVASRHPLRGLLLSVLALALLASLGPHTPIYGIVTTLLPPLRVLRYPVKIMALVAFVWALLAGLGVEVWRERLRGRAFAVASASLALVLGLAASLAAAARFAPEAMAARLVDLPPDRTAAVVFGSLSVRLAVTSSLLALALLLAFLQGSGRMDPRRAGFALAALALLDLGVYHRSPNPTAPKTLYTSRPELLTAIGDPASARVYVYDYSIPGKTKRYLEGRSPFALARMPEGFSLDAASALGMQMCLASETAGRWGLPQAYTLDYRGLHATPLARLEKLLRDVEETPAELRLLQAGGVTHVVSFHALEDLRAADRISGFFERPVLLSRVPEPLPRTYVVGRARRADDTGAVELLLDPSFDIRGEVVLDDGEKAGAQPGLAGTSRLLDERADRIVLEAELDRPGTLVLLDGYDPGWRARVDGQEAPLRRANLAFRAVAVPAGRHRVEMVYRPRGLGFGLGVSALSLIALALTWAGAPGSAAPPERP